MMSLRSRWEYDNWLKKVAMIVVEIYQSKKRHFRMLTQHLAFAFGSIDGLRKGILRVQGSEMGIICQWCRTDWNSCLWRMLKLSIVTPSSHSLLLCHFLSFFPLSIYTHLNEGKKSLSSSLSFFSLWQDLKINFIFFLLDAHSFSFSLFSAYMA